MWAWMCSLARIVLSLRTHCTPWRAPPTLSQTSCDTARSCCLLRTAHKLAWSARIKPALGPTRVAWRCVVHVAIGTQTARAFDRERERARASEQESARERERESERESERVRERESERASGRGRTSVLDCTLACMHVCNQDRGILLRQGQGSASTLIQRSKNEQSNQRTHAKTDPRG